MPERTFRQRRADGAADGSPPVGKLAQQLAYELEREVIQRGWPVGQVLGSEHDLIDKYGVSRAIFREAVRIVEHHTVARMRRGPNGGLVVTAPDPLVVQRAATLYLDYADVPPDDLFQVRAALEVTCAEQATQRLDEAGIERLRATLEREAQLGNDISDIGHTHDFHIVLADLTGNAAMRLFVEILTRLTFERTGHSSYRKEATDEVHRAHSAIAQAVIAGDSALAQHRMRQHLVAVADFYHQRADLYQSRKP